jgi:hypothetical protein
VLQRTSLLLTPHMSGASTPSLSDAATPHGSLGTLSPASEQHPLRGCAGKWQRPCCDQVPNQRELRLKPADPLDLGDRWNEGN